MPRPANLFFAAFCGLSAPAIAKAQEPAILQEIGQCRRIVASAQRLDCFDKVTIALEAAVRSKALTVLDAEGIRQTRRSLFGFSLPATGIFARTDERDIDEVEAVAGRFLEIGHGNYEFILDDGARWQTTEPPRFPPTKNAALKIKRASLGSYFIAIDGSRGVKGRRIR